MSKGNRTEERLSHLLQRGDPAGEAPSATPDPMRRAALLTRCSENLSQPGYAPERVAPTHLPFAVGALVLVGSLLLLCFWMTRPKMLSPVPQIAVSASPVPAAPSSDAPSKPAAKSPDKPKAAVARFVATNRPKKENQRNRTIARKYVKAQRPPILALQSPVKKPRLITHPQPKPHAVQTPTLERAPEPVVERVILIADATLPEPEPNTRSVTIILTNESRAVIASRPAAETRR